MERVWGFEMQTLTPSVQDEAEGLQGVELAAQDSGPLFDGPVPVLWAGFGVFVVTFVIVLMLIIRGRVLRPAQRNVVGANFFEPAGEDADITFDDDDASLKVGRDSPPGGFDANSEGRDNDNEEELRLSAERPAEREKAPPKRSPFAGLFSKKPTREKEKTEPADQLELEEAESDGETIIAPAANDWRPQPPPSGDDSAGDRDNETRRAKEAHAQEAARERDAEYERRQTEAAIERRLQSFSDMDEARPAGAEPEKPSQELDIQLGNWLENRFAVLFNQLETRIENAAQNGAQDAADNRQPVISEAHFAEFAELISEQIAALRDAAIRSVETLTKRIDRLETTPAGAADLAGQIARLNRILDERSISGSGARIKLPDLLARALPPARYALAHALSNGETAGALIELSASLAPVAIDGHFPVEAFEAYQRRRLEPGGAGKAESEFRRVVLRQITDAAEKLVIPGETADCAMMFIPSEHIFAELNADFPDLIQESNRARVWIVSPASLMATLNVIASVMSGARETSDDGIILEELAALRNRISTLETGHDQDESPPAPAPQETLRENGAQHFPAPSQAAPQPASNETDPGKSEEPAYDETTSPEEHVYRSLSPEEEAFERLEREEALAEASERGGLEKAARPPFPLR